MLNDVAAAAAVGMRTALFAGDERSLRKRDSDERVAGIDTGRVCAQRSVQRLGGGRLIATQQMLLRDDDGAGRFVRLRLGEPACSFRLLLAHQPVREVDEI